MNDILIRNPSSLRPYLPNIRPQTPISTNTRKTILKPMIEQPSLSSLPKKTDNFNRKNEINNHKKSKRTPSSIPVSRRHPSTNPYQNPSHQFQMQREPHDVQKLFLVLKGKNTLI